MRHTFRTCTFRLAALWCSKRDSQIRTVVEDVSGISESRSKAIAREYESLEDLRGSSRERLESVPDIGAQRAENVLERVRE